MRLTKFSPEMREFYKTFEKWSDKSWSATLSAHEKEIQYLSKKPPFFDFWTNTLSDNPVALHFFPEIFFDSYMSIQFASMGLYKYAIMCLRSELESTLKMIYFSDHPVEFKWWVNGIEIDGITSKKHVWGDGYVYFQNLDNIKLFNSKFNDKNQLINNIKTIYSTISKYVHTSAKSFQTSQSSITPKYDIEDFNGWKLKFDTTQEYIHVLLILIYFEKFKLTDSKDRDELIKICVNDSNYNSNLKKTINDLANV
ncbi:MAG: hypothetical protein PHF57_01645 [Methanoregula sp.]|jgi:hypothetical protein|nr:hypothetical protein [Methanoregula sp.]